MIADAGEDVENLAIAGRGIATPLVASSGSCSATRNFNGRLVARFFFAIEVALQFDVNVVLAEDAGEPVHRAPGFNRPSF